MSRLDARAPLAITAVGLATSVGSSAPASVAALRAGMARVHEVAAVVLPGPDGPVHPAAAQSPLCHGAGPTKRGGRLLSAALSEATAGAPLTRLDVELGPGAGDVGGEAAAGHDLDRAVLHRGPAEALSRCASLVRLVDLAQAPPTEGPVAVAAVDSLVALDVLARWARLGRLKSAGTPAGFVPGEAAAAVVVEPEPAARAAGRPVLAVVEGWGRGTEPVPLGATTPSRADGLTDALAGAVAGLPDGAGVDLVVPDLNGERARALEWGLAAPRALPPWQGRLPVWTPADGAGECGAAAGLLLVACAAQALAAGLVDADRVLVVASDDGGARCALVLHRADAVGPFV